MKKKYFSLLILPCLLTSCRQSIKLEFKAFDSYIEEQSLMRDFENDYFIAKKETTSVTTKFGEINTLRDLLTYSKGDKPRENIVPIGDRKLLVVPIYFTDSDTSKQEEKTIFIQNAFFGESKRTNYESVASYYNKSSYGQLRLTGEVSPWVPVGVSMQECLVSNELYMDVSSRLVEKAVDYLKANTNIDFAQYDTDNDNNLDGVYCVYDYPHTKDGNTSSLLWAYTHYTYEGQNGLNTSAPYVNDYSWTSIDMIRQSDNRSYTNYLIH